MVTPLGRCADDLWRHWSNGHVAAGSANRLNLDFFGVRYVAEVKEFNARKEVKNRKLLRLMIDGEMFGFVAVTNAFEDAGLSPGDYLPERAGVSVGCHKEGFRDSNLYDALDAAQNDDGEIDRARLIEEGVRRIPPQTLVEGLANAALYYFAHEFVLQGANYNFISSGTGGMLAIGEAMRSIRRDEADLMLAGGYDTWIDWRCIGHQRYIGGLSVADRPPHLIQKPFDRDRDGGVAGEGAGMVILESHSSAVDRRASILGEVSGFAAGTGAGSDDRDAHADAYARVIRRALDDAGRTADEVDLIHLQGEGSADSDWIECQAVSRALGEHAMRVPATSIKSATGLLGNASGPVEVIMTLEMLRRGEVLPVVNLKYPDPEFSLNFVREPVSEPSMKCALVLQRSWPRHFTAIVVERGDS